MKKKVTKAISARKKELKDAIDRQRDLRTLGSQINDTFIDDGRARIDVDLTEEQIYAPMSRGKQQRLNGEIFEHIEQTANLLPALVPLRVVFYGVEPDSRESVQSLYRSHYNAVVQDKLWDKHSNTRKMIYMILVGVVFLALYFLLMLHSEDDMFLEILSIIGSFSLWEAANCFLLERRNLQRELMAVAQFMTAELAFADDES